MFPKEQRVTEKKDFDRIFEKGTAIHCDVLMIKILKNNLGIRRFAVIVSKKISNKATQRNEVKRKVREILRLNQDKFPESSDIVAYTKPAIKGESSQEIEKNILGAIRK